MKQTKENLSNEDMLRLTKKVGVEALFYLEELPKETTCNSIGNQLLENAINIGCVHRQHTKNSDKKQSGYFKELENLIAKCEYWLDLLNEVWMKTKTFDERIRRALTELKEAIQ